MDVEVEDGLSGAGANIENGAIALFDVALASDLSGGKMATADDFGVVGFGFLQSSEMFFGDDEHVRGSLRINVFEGEDVVVFVDFFRGDFSAQDAAEEAVGIGHIEFTRAGYLGNDSIGEAGLSANKKSRPAG